MDTGLRAAVSQDWMCEPWILERTTRTIAEHQRLTIERYDDLARSAHVYIMPVLQGYAPADYLSHLDQYGDRLAHGAWVGVGSVCKRNRYPSQIEDVLVSISRKRPDLRLHGFGLKSTALASGLVQDVLHSCDSMAWSYAARRQGCNANSWHEAAAWLARLKRQPVQLAWDFVPQAIRAARDA